MDVPNRPGVFMPLNALLLECKVFSADRLREIKHPCWRMVFLLVPILLTAACDDRIDGYIPVKEIARNGFLIDEQEADELSGQQVRLWGYVDHGNLYGDAGAREILDEWWAGEGPDAGSSRFNLKADAGDATGHSFAVHVPNGEGRDALLRKFVADAGEQRPTRVFLKGKLLTFDAATQISGLTGIYLEVESSQDIQLTSCR
jgi:hypothetical protein